MKRAKQSSSSEGVRWQWPINITIYDRDPALRVKEQATVEHLMVNPATQDLRSGYRSYGAVERIVRPILDVCDVQTTPPKTRAKLVGRLLIEMHKRQKTFWGWTREEWIETVGTSQAEFIRRYRHGEETRQYMAAVSYLLTDCIDIRMLGRLNSVPFAGKVFGQAVVNESVETVRQTLSSWGFTNYFRHRWSNALCFALIVNRSPHLEDLTLGFLQDLRDAQMPEYLKAQVPNLSRVLVSLGILRRALPHRTSPTAQGEEQELALRGVAPEWARWCRNWYETSTLTAKTRQNTYYAVLIAGRWAAQHRPREFTPEHWTRELAASYVAAVCRMTVGQYSHHHTIAKNKIGKPFTARAKAHLLSAARLFFRDCQSWGWLPCRFDPQRCLATPRSVKAQIGPDPRSIADDVWAKLLWAGLNLTADDLPTSTPWHKKARTESWYPLEMLRAVVIVWLFAGLRSDEIRRLRVGAVRREQGGTSAEERNMQGTKDAVCLLDVPINKTQTAFTKPVDGVVGEAVERWEKLRPSQPPAVDQKTGEVVHYLFFYRGSCIGSNYLNETLIPMLCRKAGVPVEDARGKITSHRARSTVASQLANAKDPLSLFELQAWLGHRNPNSTMSYVKSNPTKLVKAYTKAEYFKRNIRMVEVLIDQEAVKNGSASAGEAWKYYDLGHGYCTYDFFDQCVHRMACAKCNFYLPKDSSRAQLLEAQANLQRMLQEIPLREEERAAVEDGLGAVEKLFAQLRDVPTPAGPTPRELTGSTRRELPVLPTQNFTEG